MLTPTLPVWPYVYGFPPGTGKIRSVPDDFIVRETLSFTPSGTGEHAFLQIEKTGENTEYVARQLARFADVRQRDIGYAGLKDRHAVTTQWFSVWLPGKPDPDWSAFESEAIKVKQALRHARKLKRGALAGNAFVLILRDWQGDQARTEQILQTIKEQGIANYYGEQRFGHAGQNVANALLMFQGKKTGREQRSLYLSAARSFLFNHMLALRVRQHTWNQVLPGDTVMIDGSHSHFCVDQPAADVIQRVQEKRLHPAGMLWGKGVLAAALEQYGLSGFTELADGLVNAGLELDWRPLRVNVSDLRWQFLPDNQLQLQFSLPAGSYATAVLREMVTL